MFCYYFFITWVIFFKNSSVEQTDSHDFFLFYLNLLYYITIFMVG